MTPLAGILFLLTFDHSWWPGTARSRLNANSIRDALVWQAVVQNSWPAVEISSTMRDPLGVHRLGEDHRDGTAALGHRRRTSCTANRNDSSRIQPPIAE